MKRQPNLDFASDRAARQRGRKVVFAILGLLFGLQIGVAAWRLQSIEAQHTALDLQYRQLTGKSAREHHIELTAEQQKTAGGARLMLDSLSIPWEGLLGAIEVARPQRILIDAIQPHAQEGGVSISVNSPDFAGLAEFIQRLSQQDLLHDVMLVSEALPENSGSSLRAVIRANWRTQQ